MLSWLQFLAFHAQVQCECRGPKVSETQSLPGREAPVAHSTVGTCWGPCLPYGPELKGREELAWARGDASGGL